MLSFVPLLLVWLSQLYPPFSFLLSLDSFELSSVSPEDVSSLVPLFVVSVFPSLALLSFAAVQLFHALSASSPLLSSSALIFSFLPLLLSEFVV